MEILVDTVSLNLIFPSEKAKTIDTMPTSPTKHLGKRCGNICNQSLSIYESNMASPMQYRAQQCQRSLVNENIYDFEIQCQFESNQEGRERPNSLNWKLTMQSPILSRIPNMTRESDVINKGGELNRVNTVQKVVTVEASQ